MMSPDPLTTQFNSEVTFNQRLVVPESWFKQRRRYLAACHLAAMSKCAICSIKFSNINPPCLDHCHKSLNFRGFLCRPCNALLGFARDDIKILKKAIRYLRGPIV